MRESKESYYDIFGVAENCTKDDIKHAYIELCKNYHPDKLPPNTPEGAKKFISERMVLINEAYEILKDENKRRQYDIKINIQVSNPRKDAYRDEYQRNDTPTGVNDINELFNQALLERALVELEFEEKQFDNDLKNALISIEKKYSRHLRSIKNHISGSIEVNDSSMKLEKSIAYGFATFVALWIVPLGGFLSVIGWIFLILFSAFFIKAVSSPVYRSDYVKEVKTAKAIRDQGLIQFKNTINQRINYFKKIPIYSINYEFVHNLLPRDRLLLVKALKQREDTEKAEKSVQSTIKVAAAMGLLAIFLSSISS
jgi:curved DNA-binding protein CbpA